MPPLPRQPAGDPPPQTRPLLPFLSVTRCFGCGVAGYPGDRFCACCGKPLNRACRHCGAAIIHPVASFCSACGGELEEK